MCLRVRARVGKSVCACVNVRACCSAQVNSCQQINVSVFEGEKCINIREMDLKKCTNGDLVGAF